MIYDLCSLDKQSTFKMNLIANGGSYSTKVLARLDKISQFKVLCPSKGDIFKSRTDHGAC